MNISELSLKRPIFATVMNILIVLFGAVGFSFLSVRDYPAIDPPIVTVSTSYTGANPDIVENQITEPLEKEINGIPGIRSITSSSTLGRSTITVEFNLGSDLEAAASDVRDKAAQASRNLPQDIDAPPVVSKADANSDFILLLAIQSKSKSLLELSDYAENVLQQRFQTINDVSGINILGQKRYAMRLWLKPDLMNSHNISFTDLQNSLSRENVEIPAGKIYGANTEMTIRAMGRLTTEQQFRDLIIRQDADGIVRLGDIAEIELGPESLETSWKYNGVSAVGMALVPQPGANYIDIADEFYKRLEEIKKENKSDIEFKLLIDNTKNVRNSLKEVEETLIISLGLVIIVIFLFFRDWLIAIRPLVDIPISLIATFFVMYWAGFSINVLTLLGIVLATGLVVDDGIVVTENIFRKLEEGMPIRKAALEGSKEIFFAVISTSLTLAVVFLPVIFLQGFVGSLFREFGIVVAGAVLISAFVSLTITPVLNVVMSRKKHSYGWFYLKTEPFFVGMENGYKRMLNGFMNIRWMAWVIVVVCAGIIWFVGKDIQSEIAPMEDKSSVRFTITAPEGSSFDFTKNVAEELTTYLNDSVPEMDFVFNAVPGFGGSGGTNSSIARVGLVAPTERKRSQQKIAKDLNEKLSQFNNARIFAVQEQTISVGSGSRSSLPVQFVIQNVDLTKIKTVLPKFLEEARNEKTFQNVDVNLKFNKPELLMTFDRIKIKDLGLSTQDVVSAVQGAFSGRRLAYFTMNGRQYQVIGQVERTDRKQPLDITNVYVTNSRAERIPLSAVVKLEESSNPSTIYHFNRLKSAIISASLAEGKTIGDGVKAMQKIAGKTLDNTFQTALNGPSRDYAESSSNTSFAFGLALVLIYLLLAAQFESFKDPLTIMLTVPLALAGALLSLWFFNQTLNIFSQIGMIMLIGLVTKNGILIVEFANHKRAEGLPIFEAVVEASAQRLRPILMTSLATSLGALPIAMSLGAAATSRIPLGIVVVGGILFSLILTLLVIPAVYTFISGKKDHQPESEEEAEFQA
ncbi:efflux RND transporter permease subunit [Flectobacillus longus]|uniref:Efflux RND transporter permease subunit n=1 Tax=Flectobacillus longus TaxID=2984207 RepID=A0ABT6YHB5_9BACT|nr:efflux RND transporter permease subunit [Flectobacillus longus]MDI9862824.1 efflux RND transporter permease subunit [Flectobacillus longus]MDI9882757.1 efflux RND transporter permease subunit [Flectobacillus longus]